MRWPLAAAQGVAAVGISAGGHGGARGLRRLQAALATCRRLRGTGAMTALGGGVESQAAARGPRCRCLVAGRDPR